MSALPFFITDETATTQNDPASTSLDQAKEEAYALIREFAGHTFFDKETEQTHPRCDATATEQMCAHFDYLFSGEEGRAYDLRADQLLFTQLVFTLVCESTGANGFATDSTWYPEASAKGLMEDPKTGELYINPSYFLKEAAVLDGRLEQADLAQSLLPPKIIGIAKEVATTIICDYPVVAPWGGKTRTAVAVQMARELFDNPSRQRAIDLGVSEAQAALQKAFKQLQAERAAKNAKAVTPPETETVETVGLKPELAASA